MEIIDYELFSVPPRWLFLKLETDTGLCGWGEPIVEGRAKTVRAAVEELIDTYLLEESPLTIEDHWQAMYRGGFYRGGPILMSAISGIDQALWDIKGKHHDVPIYELLGGPVRKKVQVYQWIGGDRPSDVGDAAMELVDAGIEALKMNATEEFQRVETPKAVAAAAERVATVRDAVGPSVNIGVDFHGRVAKSMVPRLAEVLEEHEPMFIEEPVLPEHNDALPELASQTTIPIATGERMYSRFDFKSLLASNAVDIIQPDPSHAGGITELRKIANLAEAYDVALAPHCPLGPISLAAALQIDACAPNALIQEQSLGIHYNDAADVMDYLNHSSIFNYADGFVAIPDGPGLGISINEELVRERAGDIDWHNPVWRHEDGSIAEW